MAGNVLHRLASLPHRAVLAIGLGVAFVIAGAAYLLVPATSGSDSFTAAVALYGAVIATLTELRSASSKERTFEFLAVLEVHTDATKTTGKQIVRFTNTAERVAVIDGISLRAPGKRARTFVHSVAELKGPLRLEDGDFVIGEVDATQLARSMRAAGYAGEAEIFPVCTLTDGTLWKAPPILFNCDEWAQAELPAAQITTV